MISSSISNVCNPARLNGMKFAREFGRAGTPFAPQMKCSRGISRERMRMLKQAYSSEKNRIKIKEFRNSYVVISGITATMLILFAEKVKLDSKSIDTAEENPLSTNEIRLGVHAPDQIFESSAIDDSSNKANHSNLNLPKIIFVGSGSSTGCPRPLCALLFPPNDDNHHLSPELKELQKQYASSCKVSRLASENDPRLNKNYRNNPSILISHFNQDDVQSEPEEEVLKAWLRDDNGNGLDTVIEKKQNNLSRMNRKNVIIDVGKTFREGSLRWLPPNRIHSLDAIVLTHGHMDSMGGLDDVRGFQKRHHHVDADTPAAVNTPGPKGGLEPIPVFLNQDTMNAVKRQFYYLVPKDTPELQADGRPYVKRLVAALDYRIVEDFEPFYAAGLKMIPLPVMHGEDMVCLGFAFSLKQPSYDQNGIYHERSINVVYLSDISRMLPATEKYIEQHLPPIDILVIDSLLQFNHNSTHQSMREAIQLAKRLGPDKVYLVGMNCDDFLPHDEMNQLLKEEIHDRDKDRMGQPAMEVFLAHDGLVLDFNEYR